MSLFCLLEQANKDSTPEMHSLKQPPVTENLKTWQSNNKNLHLGESASFRRLLAYHPRLFGNPSLSPSVSAFLRPVRPACGFRCVQPVKPHQTAWRNEMCFRCFSVAKGRSDVFFHVYWHRRRTFSEDTKDLAPCDEHRARAAVTAQKAEAGIPSIADERKRSTSTE